MSGKPEHQEPAQEPLVADENGPLESAEKRLRIAEERLRALLNAQTESAMLVDLEGKILAANEIAAQRLGKGLGELAGLEMSEYLPGQLAESRKTYGERVRQTGKPVRFRDERDGRIYDNNVYPVFSAEGKVAALAIHAKDITEVKRNEQALKESAEKYRRLFELESDALFLIEKESGRILEANSTASKLYGYTREELLRKKNTDLSAEPEKTKQATHSTRTLIPIRYHRKEDGTVFPVEITASHLEWRGQDVHIASIRDITFRLGAEEERQRLESQLQQAQKLESIANLAGGIAHQFNNALSVITISLDLMELDSTDGGKKVDYLALMRESSTKMAQLTNQLLAYARGGKYQPEVIAIGGFVEDTLPLVKQSLHPDIKIDTDLPEDTSPVEADLTQLQMVLTAILENASEALDGAGVIRVSAENVRISNALADDVPGLTPGAYVRLSITDRGRGMDAGTANRVFEPFFTTKAQGTGLGMSAAYGIVKNHAGTITVDSELGEQTTVCVYIPATDADAVYPAEHQVTPAEGTGTILIIEDERMVLQVSKALIERLGYRVLTAETGEEAVRVTQTFDGKIDLAILDIGLPDMGGKDVFPLLMKSRPDLRVIVASGYSIDGPAREIMAAGAHDFIQKPFTLPILSEKLNRALDRT